MRISENRVQDFFTVAIDVQIHVASQADVIAVLAVAPGLSALTEIRCLSGHFQNAAIAEIPAKQLAQQCQSAESPGP
jgi:hypothetical protein